MRLAVATLALLLAACGAEKNPVAADGAASPAPLPTRAVPRKLIPADFNPAALGGRVEGMTVEDAPIGGRKSPLARVTAYVACAKEVTACDPEVLPEGTLYTYVLTITPVEQPERADEATPSADVDLPEPPSLTTLRSAEGFNGAAGYALAEAALAFGEENAISMLLDRGRLSWRATDGSELKAGQPITVWWQSDQPPAQPSPAYRLTVGDRRLEITAPFPATEKAAGKR